jgi:hypothetical protein
MRQANKKLFSWAPPKIAPRPGISIAELRRQCSSVKQPIGA